MLINQLHAVGVPIGCRHFIQINAVCEVNSARDTGTVVCNASTMGLNGRGTYQLHGCTNDRALAPISGN
jgi:hypothetical protein